MRTLIPLCALAACGTDTGGSTPTYLDDVAPILAAACDSCHAAPTATAEVQNCVRTDRWDSASDTRMVCTDAAMSGLVFGVHDASAMLVDLVEQGQMPFGGPPLGTADRAVLLRWRDAGFPKRSPNAPPTIQFAAPTGPVTVCNPSCTYTVAYTITDPDQDSVEWSLGWSSGGKTGTLATRRTGGTGNVTIDASALASGTYTLVATLDDGTAKVTANAPGTLTVPAGHNAAPTVTVLAPNGGEVFYTAQPITVSWSGADADDSSLTYDVVALEGTTAIPIATGLARPVGTAMTTWTPPEVTALTAVRIQVSVHDPLLSAVDTSDADFSLSPPPQMVSFATQLQPILTASCTNAQCHDANMPQQGLNLTAGAAYAAIVGVASTEATCGSYKLVLPGQPDQSYLIFKLTGSGACFSGSKMPKGAVALTAAQIQLFRDWIANGAPNN